MNRDELLKQIKNKNERLISEIKKINDCNCPQKKNKFENLYEKIKKQK